MTPLFFLIALFFTIPLIRLLVEIRRRKEGDVRTFPDVTLYNDLKSVRTKELRRSLDQPPTRDREEAPEGLMTIAGDLHLEDRSKVTKDIVSNGTVVVGRFCHVVGSIKASLVTVHDYTLVAGNIVANRDVEIGQGCRIQGLIWAGGNVRLGFGALVKGVSVYGECVCLPLATVTAGIQGNVKYIVGFVTEKGVKEVEVTSLLDAKILEMISIDLPMDEIQLRLLVNPSQIRNVAKKYLGDEKIAPMQA